MPKKEIDYSNTIIYKITCKDANVNDVYVGHTTNFVQRKHAHKQSCINIKSPNYNCKVYEVIRNNGGWNNWTMEIINFFNCIDHYGARKKEQEYFVLLNATLNSIEPMPKPKNKPIKVTEEQIKNTFYCEKCNTHCDTAKLFETHNNTKKHKSMEPKNNTSKTHPKFVCELCDFKCFKKGDYTRHIATDKHKTLINPNFLASKNITFECKCGKVYKHMSTLCAHKKKCINIDEEQTEENGYYEGINIKDKDALVLHLLKQNGELQKSLIEMSKDKSITNNNNTTHTNSHNKTFNLQFFLNETCKDALNITDFVSSIKLSLDDLENTGRQGYIEGVSNIILKNLNKLGHYDRPIHCADQKREVLYIKNDNQWFKESEEKPLLTKAIKTIANENIKQIKTWRDQNPDCTKSDSKKNNLYLKIVSNSMSGSDKVDCDKNLNKIISNVAKETLIPKENV
jgi:hypothetical protein